MDPPMEFNANEVDWDTIAFDFGEESEGREIIDANFVGIEGIDYPTQDIGSEIVVWKPKNPNQFAASSHSSGVDGLVDWTDEFTTFTVFSSHTELVQWTKEIGNQHGFVIVTKASELNPKSRAPRMRFGCERGGWYRKHEKIYDEGKVVKRRSNSTGTKKCGCPFELRCVRGKDGWKVSVANGKHNHPSALHMEGHAYAGRLSSEETSLLVEMSRSHVKPRDILNSLKQTNSENTSTIKSVYNARAKYRVQELAGRSQMQQLMKKLTDFEYVEWHRTNEEGVLTEMFWAHPTSGDLLRAFPHVLLMDCTYKTNRYRYPLLQICGVTSTHLTFTAAFAFMEGEKQENYEWALMKLKGMLVESPTVIVSDRELALMNAIAHIFPDAVNLLCSWHINKNIVAKCAKIIGKNKWSAFESQWKTLVYSPTIDGYEQQLSALKRDYVMFPRVISYLENTWLKDHKERFVQAWTDKVMHFGNTTTSRAESAHSKLKRHLESCQGNFYHNWEKIHAMVDGQRTEILSSFERSLGCVQHAFGVPIFTELRGFVSVKALEHILDEAKNVKYIRAQTHPCTCSIRQTHGLPCSHEILQCVKGNGGRIPLSSVHEHWKKLDLTPTPKDASLEQVFRADFETLVGKFKDMDNASQLHYVKKMKEFVYPACTTVQPPFSKVKSKGRPKKSVKEENSTRRDHSEFEWVEQELGLDSKPRNEAKKEPKKESNKKAKKELKKEPVRRKSQSGVEYCGSPYASQFPEGMRDNIFSIFDVEGDGNCGFRAIAHVLGFTQDSWIQVRGELLHELRTHWHSYRAMFNLEGRMEELERILQWSHGPAPREHWMTMPDLGPVIASAYNVVLVHLSGKQCLTFLPLQSPPASMATRKLIAIGYVNDSHYVSVTLKGDSPIPPISVYWQHSRDEIAAGWATPYTTRIEKFKKLVGADVVMKDTFTVD